MQTKAALAVLAELRSLALCDRQRLTAARARLTLAEEELAAAREAFDSADTRAHVSQRAFCGARELLAGKVPDPGDAPGPPGGEAGPGEDGNRPTLAQEVETYLRARGGEVPLAEITRHLGTVRPDLRPGGLGPGLSRMVGAGVILRPRTGVYAIPEAGDA
ncbi:hypothetical protein ACFUT3_15480 [Streptomyces cinereoruber]|uniref:hypothetical protein n=1 Tax=Streptomyces cinereoruber TaxID=67260 RepID=UPI00363A77EF